jgi:phage FluMu protein Com
MMELEVILDFACCSCRHDMGVTLHCAGKGLAEGARGVATVKIPCPNCGNINQLYFEPHTGAVRHVAPFWDTCRVPEPSLN